MCDLSVLKPPCVFQHCGGPPRWGSIIIASRKKTNQKNETRSFHSDLSPFRFTPYSRSDILSAHLFFHPDIPALQQPRRCFRVWADADVIRVGDILSPSGQFVEISTLPPSLHSQHNNYTVLQNAIPRSWLITLTSNPSLFSRHTRPHNFARSHFINIHPHPIPLTNITARIIRIHLYRTCCVPSNGPRRWSHHFPHALHFQWSLIWSSIRSPALTHTHQQFLWLLAHHALPVLSSPRMQAIAQSIPNALTTCPYCNAQETIAHALYDCPTIRPLFHSLTPFFNIVLPTNPSNFRQFLLLGDFMTHTLARPHSTGFDAWLFLRCSLLHPIWTMRCRALYQDEPFSLLRVLADITSSLALYANRQWRNTQSDTSPHSVFHFVSVWLPGHLTTYRCHRIYIPSLLPPFPTNTAPCACIRAPSPTTPPSLSAASEVNADFILLPPPLTICPLCSGPPECPRAGIG